jgi:hypothetical protein
MNRRNHLKLLGSTIAAAGLPRSLAAQDAAKVTRIGWVTAQQAASLVPAFAGA